MATEIKEKEPKIPRLFPFKRRKSKTEAPSNTSLDFSKKKTKLPWSPEDIFDEMHGMPTGDMHGEVLLVEVGGVDQGWVLDFTAKSDDSIVVARYDIAGFSTNNSKKPSGPRIEPGEKLDIHESLPWIWYKDRKVFSKIESGKLKEMVAYVTERIITSDDMPVFEKLEKIWSDAKENAKRRKKEQGSENRARELPSTNSEDLEDVKESDEEEDDEDDEEVDEEARIIATYKPEVEPTDPSKIEFWKRHFGTDALVSSYLFLLSSLFYFWLTIYNLQSSIGALSNKMTAAETVTSQLDLAHNIAYCFSALLFAVASVYFIKLSYPETTMIMAYRAFAKDPSSMTFLERFFTANELLIAVWIMNAAFIVPLVIVILYELVVLFQFRAALVDLLTAVVSLFFVGFLGIAGMLNLFDIRSIFIY